MTKTFDDRYQNESPEIRLARLAQYGKEHKVVRKITPKSVLNIFLLALIIGFFVLPILYLLATSFKPRSDIALGLFFPSDPTIQNWGAAFEALPLFSFIRNSFAAAVLSALITLVIIVPATYSMLKLNVGKSFLPDFTVATYVAPPVVALIPLFILLQKLSLTNSVTGLVIVYSLMNLPVGFWLLRNFITDIPKALDEAAWLDGAGYWRTLITVNLPLMLPGLVATGLICSILAFNEFLFASAMTFDPQSRTLPVGISLFQGERFVNFGHMAAASCSGIIPIYFVAVFVQKWLVGGLTQGSIK